MNDNVIQFGGKKPPAGPSIITPPDLYKVTFYRSPSPLVVDDVTEVNILTDAKMILMTTLGDSVTVNMDQYLYYVMEKK